MEDGETLRLKTLAEQKYLSNDLKSALRYAKRAHRRSPDTDGISEMLTAFQILHIAATDTKPHWYEILQVEPFSHINSIKKQYRKLALTLHPDKNPFAASEEAFKLVSEAFRVLSDKARRNEYDLKLRIAMQDDACSSVDNTFWTACSTCRLLHQFERKYLGHELICPNCEKSFNAVETVVSGKRKCGGEDDDNEDQVGTRASARISSKRKMSSVGEILQRAKVTEIDYSKIGKGLMNMGASRRRDGREVRVYEKPKRGEADKGDEMMTLAEIQKMLGKGKSNDQKSKSKESQREKEDKRKEKHDKGEAKSGNSIKERRESSNGNSKRERKELSNGDSEIMTVEDSDFYDFDKGRVERSFKKGQVWAIYDDDDGMPRHYGLINEVVSVHPFEVEMSWLDPYSNGNEGFMRFQKTRFHISCGRFKVSGRTSLRSLNVFSHVINCERAAREVYRIYPKKGSVWALYNESVLDGEGRNSSVKDKRCYDIVLFLTSYSEDHGLSMAYLEKVIGFRTVFKRREIGCHAIRWLEKDNVGLFSHQIPARKLSGEEAKDFSEDCWELDPASLPPELLTVKK